MLYSRRDFTLLTLAALQAPRLLASDKSVVDGVMIGAQSYSFRDRSLDEAIKGYQETGLTFAELWQGHVEPKGLSKEDMAKWRSSGPLDEVAAIKKKFDAAGIKIYAFNYSFSDDLTDEQIQHAFDMAKALGTDKITASSHVSIAKRLDPFAKRNKVYVGMHNHSNKKPDEFARPEDFEQAMAGNSKYICINLDIGHFTAADYDPVSYLEQHHERIITLHLKDRKKNQGPNLPFGQGDTKIKEVLQLLKTNKWKIPAMIEYEYKGDDPVAEVKKCYQFCKEALA
jgi:sugar phosphate isomerase/epimerase